MDEGVLKAIRGLSSHPTLVYQLGLDESPQFPLQRRLIQLRFFEQRSQSEIAEELGTSQMQVSRLLSRLLVKMRTIIGVPESLPAAS